MKIGLIAEDSKLPNYALMKVYAYHKSIGDEVDFALPFEYYDIIYRSKIFNFSQPDNGVYFSQLTIKGGTGYDIASKLPDYIDNLNPEILKVLIISNNNIWLSKKLKKTITAGKKFRLTSRKILTTHRYTFPPVGC